MISTNEIYKVLLFEFPYFKKINEERRELLCKRTQEFIEGTQFIPRRDMVLTNRMKILISACSQQLTLGFKNDYQYAYFEKIIVYPEKYLSTHTGRYHTGEMNTAGIIVLSWEDFYKGITIDNDTHNVGLHEFAHALEFMDIADKNIDEIFSACLDKFTALADFYLKHQPDKPLFRSYATTNLAEFFAVATEYYFEAPKEFAVREPELFDVLNKAYQQTLAPHISVKRNLTMHTASRLYLKDDRSLSKRSSLYSYLIIGAVTAILAYNTSLIIALIFAGIMFCLDILAVPLKTFSLYDGYVTVQQNQKTTKQFMQHFFSEKESSNPVIDYSDILYVNAQHISDDEGTGEHYSYTLHYLQQNKLLKLTCVTSDLNYDRVLRFLYLEKKVGTRLNGKYKKYKTV